MKASRSWFPNLDDLDWGKTASYLSTMSNWSRIFPVITTIATIHFCLAVPATLSLVDVASVCGPHNRRGGPLEALLSPQHFFKIKIVIRLSGRPVCTCSHWRSYMILYCNLCLRGCEYSPCDGELAKHVWSLGCDVQHWTSWLRWCVPPSPNTQEVKTGRSEAQGHPELQRESGYMRPCLKFLFWL